MVCSSRNIISIMYELILFLLLVLDLTLVDLPGLTKVPVGDQPLEIETLVKQYTVWGSKIDPFYIHKKVNFASPYCTVNIRINIYISGNSEK